MRNTYEDLLLLLQKEYPTMNIRIFENLPLPTVRKYDFTIDKYHFDIRDSDYMEEDVNITVMNYYIDERILDITCGYSKVAFNQIKQFINMISDDWDYRDGEED